MKAMIINPYTNVRKMNSSDFWAMLEEQENRHDAYTYTMLSTTTDFDVVYTTVYDENRTAGTISDFLGYYLDSQIRVDGVAIVLQHCDDFDMVFVIED